MKNNWFLGFLIGLVVLEYSYAYELHCWGKCCFGPQEHIETILHGYNDLIVRSDNIANASVSGSSGYAGVIEFDKIE